MAISRFLALVLSIAPTFVGCASVLGIEQATHDSTLDKGGTGNGGNGNTGGGGGGGGTDKPLCETYCDTIGASCTGANEQYESRAICLRTCSRLEEGQFDDDVGNTVHCRLHYAKSAADAPGEAAGACSAAGPGGAQLEVVDLCGTFCEGLCTIALATCRGANFRFTSLSECRLACEALPDLGNYNDKIIDGNSVQCRLYHVSAAQIDPIIHCPHVGGDVGPCKIP
jgi:hypothetical protein